MSEQLVPNVFGEMVQHTVTVPKPKIREMSLEERKQYNADRQAAHRAKKKKELELAEERTRLENDERNQAIREEQEFQRSIPTTPKNWDEEIAKQLEPVLDQVILELDRPGPWLYKRDYCIVSGLAHIAFGVPKMVTIDNAGLRVAGIFPDAQCLMAIEYDKTKLFKSKAFRMLYADALRETVNLMADPKNKPYLQWTMQIKREFEDFEV